MHTDTGRWQLGFTMSLTTAVLWGMLPIALKVVLTGMDVYTIIWWRFAVSMLGLGAFLVWQGQFPRLRGTRRNAWVALAVALVTLLGNYVLYLVALDHTTPSVAQVVIQLAPLLLLLGGVFVVGDRFVPLQWLGFFVLVVGMLLFFNNRLPELARPTEGLGLGVAVQPTSTSASAMARTQVEAPEERLTSSRPAPSVRIVLRRRPLGTT